VFSSGFFITPIMNDLGASKASVALAGSLLSGFYLIVGPIVSGKTQKISKNNSEFVNNFFLLHQTALTNRYGFRLVTIFGSLMAASAFALSSFAKSMIHLHIFYGILGGIGFCCIYLPSVIIVGYYFEKWRPLATGIALCGSGVGTFIMAPISNALIASYGWQNALMAQGGKQRFHTT
jgi:MFS transporter, MCT family, solute carrier family 16 (monocarboxylic acid transporters), member 14